MYVSLMSQSAAQRQALSSVLGEGGRRVSPAGTCKIQEKRGTRYAALPKDQALVDGLAQSSELVGGYDPVSRTYLFSPVDAVGPGHWAEDFL